jgi:antitoxin component of MazEF toxin-antitoxin module
MPQKENRKLVQIGKTSVGVILPKAWLRYFSLEHGDKVEVVSNGNITIKPLVKDPAKESPAT